MNPVLIFIKVETKFPYFPPPSASIWGANSLIRVNSMFPALVVGLVELLPLELEEVSSTPEDDTIVSCGT